MPKCCPNCWQYYECWEGDGCCSECDYYSNGECLYYKENYEEFEKPY